MFDFIGTPKMVIRAYRDTSFNQEVARVPVMLNPETYSLDYEIEFKKGQAPGTSGSELTFEKIKPQKLDFEFLFDRTGAIPGQTAVAKDGVHPDIEKFKEIVIGFDGSIHRTNYLILSWGKLLFKCCCTRMNVTYKLFRPDGVPLRAVVKAAFEEFKEKERRVKEENKNSPDLTHVRTVKAGDTLPLMTYRIYGDSRYYLEVAKANQLSDFRKMEVGQQIFFPPIEK